MKILVDNLNCRIETDNEKLLEALCKLYRFHAPGYQYSPAYKRRQWDGYNNFITKKGSFKTGLLSRVIKDLKKINCYPEIVEAYSKSTQGINSIQINGFTYYDYQERLISKALKCKRAVIKSPTGSGKTLIMAGLVQALQGRKMVILFNAKQLLIQTYKFLAETCGFDNIGLCYGEGYIYGDVILCTVQSIEKILDTHLDDSEVLMVDECHEFSNGRTTLAAIQSFPKALYRFGLTATAPNADVPKYSLEGALGPVIEEYSTSDLVETGHLTKPVIKLIKRDYSASGEDLDLSYLEIYDKYIVNNTHRNNQIKQIVDNAKESNTQSRILILTKSLAHGRALENLLGGQCKFLEGANSLGERYQSISRFRGHSGPSVLIGTKILQTGINIEEITHLINARGMKSEIATIQALGRALRRHDSKSVVYVYDFMDQEKYLKNHSLARKRHYLKEGHEVIVI